MNEYADVKWNTNQYVVCVHHGSGDGRSYGYGEMWRAEEDGWANSDQTTTWYIFDNEDDAKKKAAEVNEYYDGSDYR